MTPEEKISESARELLEAFYKKYAELFPEKVSHEEKIQGFLASRIALTALEQIIKETETSPRIDSIEQIVSRAASRLVKQIKSRILVRKDRN